jgi:hypothetical protein
MIFLPPFRNRDWRIITRTPNTNQTGGSEHRTTRKEREKKKKTPLRTPRTEGNSRTPSPKPQNKTGGPPHLKADARRIRVQETSKEKEGAKNSRTGWMDGS